TRARPHQPSARASTSPPPPQRESTHRSSSHQVSGVKQRSRGATLLGLPQPAELANATPWLSANYASRGPAEIAGGPAPGIRCPCVRLGSTHLRAGFRAELEVAGLPTPARGH